MRFWFSTLPLPEALISELAAADLEPWPNDQGSPNGDPCLLVYDSPERVITAAANAEAKINSAALAESYCELLRGREASRQPLLAGWRLERVGALGLQHWLAGNGPSSVVGDADPIQPMVASVILSLLDTQPQLLEAYNDLELQAELLGGKADLTYRQRLKQAITQDDPLPELLAALQTRDDELKDAGHEAEPTRQELQQVLEQQLLNSRNHGLQGLQANIQALQQELQPKVDHLEQQLLNRDRDLQQTRQEAELTLLQLHQVQKELEQLFLSDRQKQQLLDTRTQELQGLQANIQALQQELQPKVDHLEQQLLNRDRDLQQTREEAELTLLQLHQVQEELERYFLQTRAGNQLVESQTDPLHRVKHLMAKLAVNEFTPSGDMAAVAVEVLAPADPSRHQPSLQVEALLNTYASTIERASELLTRAMRR